MTVGFKTEVSSSNVNTAFVSRKDVEQVVQSKQDFNHQGELKRPNRLDVKTGTEADLLDYAENTAEASEVSLCFATDTEAFYIIRSNALVAAGGGGGGLDKWVSTEAYEVDDVIWLEADDTIYRCITDNSDATFTPTKWTKLSAETLQQAYENQASGDIQLNDTQGGINFIDHSTPLDSAFKVSNNDESVEYIDVNEERVQVTDSDGTFIVRPEIRFRQIEDFKVTDAATFFPTLTGATVSDNIATPIDGHRSVDIDFTATNDSAQTITLDVSLPVYKLSTIGLSFASNTTADRGDVRVELYATDGVTPRLVNNLDIRTGGQSNLIKCTLNDTDTGLYAVFISANGAVSVTLDNFGIELDVDTVITEVESGAARLHTATGYGSTDNKIVRYSDVSTEGDKNFVSITSSQEIANGFFTLEDSSASGAVLVANKESMVVLSATGGFLGGNAGFGISLNSTELTTAILDINTADRLTGTNNRSTSGTSATTAFPVKVKAGDKLRIHTDGSTIANGVRHSVGITATQTTKKRIVKGETSELDWNPCSMTYVGFSSITNEVTQCKIVGDTLFAKGFFTAGVTSAVLGALVIPNGKKIDIEKINDTANRWKLGKWNRLNATDLHYAGGNAGFFTYNGTDLDRVFVTYNNASDTSFSISNANSVLIGGDSMSYELEIPIRDASASDIVYQVPVGDQTLNNYGAKFQNNGVLTKLSFDGADVLNATRTNSGRVTIDYSSLGLTEVPRFNTEIISSAVAITEIHVVNATTTSCDILTLNNSGAYEDYDFDFELVRQGSDYREPTGIVANAAKVNHKTGGVEYETGELWNGQKIYARSFEYIGDINSTATIATIEPNLTCLKMEGVAKSTTNSFYVIDSSTGASANGLLAYLGADGKIRANLTGAGVIERSFITIKYLK